MSEILVGHEHTIANIEAMISATNNPIHRAVLIEATNMVRGQATTIDALRKEAAEAIWQAYKEGCNDGVFNENDNTSKPGRFFCDSTARRAAQRIGGAE